MLLVEYNARYTRVLENREALRLMQQDLTQAQGVIDQLHDEIGGLYADWDEKRIEISRLSNVVKQARALTEDDWGPLSETHERCPVCRCKWTKHDTAQWDRCADPKNVGKLAAKVRAALDGKQA